MRTGDPPRTRHRREIGVAVLAAVLLGLGATLLLGGGALSAVRPLGQVAGVEQIDVEGTDVEQVAGADGLDVELVTRFVAARDAAAADGVDLEITSGVRSEAEQQKLFDEAVAFHGTVAIARRWVLPPEESGHVQGAAVDVGPMAGQVWLDEHGEQFGLCRVYENEPWHFEATVDPGQSCPPLRTDVSSE